jgi:hypothetical protein
MNTRKIAAAISKNTSIKKNVHIYAGYILKSNGPEATLGYYTQSKGMHPIKMQEMADALTTAGIAFKKTTTHLIIDITE